MAIQILLSTIDDESQARRLAAHLVEERLAACVNIVPKVTSVYKWKGKLEEASELLLVIKTRAELADRLTARLAELHPYDVPECIVLEVVSGHQPYLDWVIAETG